MKAYGMATEDKLSIYRLGEGNKTKESLGLLADPI